MTDDATSEPHLEQAEELLRARLGGRVRELRVVVCDGGVVLRGWAFRYYDKQLAQHTAITCLRLQVRANEIVVRWDLPEPARDHDGAE